MDTIEREELQALLAADDPTVRVVMVLGGRRFAKAHIPGSETFDAVDEALERLDPDDDIVVYCSGEHCTASSWASRVLASRGYGHVRRYVGGLADWDAAGLPLASAAADARVGEVAA